VVNHSGGVDLEVEGRPQALDAFVAALTAEAPPLAHIEALTTRSIPCQGFPGFEIRHSERQEGRYQLISPDVATCPACLRELLDPNNRRYRYPFTNCTNCGPRFTIITDIPYDRPNTTMRAFPLCPTCQQEYDDPSNRRFHAQPNACPACGPHLWLADAAGRPLAGDAEHADPAVLDRARDLLLAGQIVGVKGLAGSSWPATPPMPRRCGRFAIASVARTSHLRSWSRPWKPPRLNAGSRRPRRRC